MNRCTVQLKNKITVVVVVELQQSIIFQHIWEWIACNVSSSKRNRPMTLSHVSVQDTFTLRLSCSCSKCSLRHSLPQMTQLCWLVCPVLWNFASSLKTMQVKKLLCFKICAHMCRKLWSKLFITCYKFLDCL
jgi:hypothetical protein